MRSTALQQAGVPGHELDRLNRVATAAAVETVFAMAAERSRAEAEAAQTAEDREQAEYWIERWRLASAEDVHPDDFAQLQEDITQQIQWAIVENDELYLPEVDREFIADYQMHGRHFALARAHVKNAYEWVDPEERRQELLKRAWSYSPIEPYIDGDGEIRLFHTVGEQREAEREREREREQPVTVPQPAARETVSMRSGRWPSVAYLFGRGT